MISTVAGLENTSDAMIFETSVNNFVSTGILKDGNKSSTLNNLLELQNKKRNYSRPSAASESESWQSAKYDESGHQSYYSSNSNQPLEQSLSQNEVVVSESGGLSD